MSKQEDKMIRELKSFEVNPPNDLWNDIDSTLKARSRKRILLVTSWASAATIALLVSVGGYFTLQKDANILTQTKPTALPSKDQSNTTIKENLTKNITATIAQMEIEKSRTILTSNSIAPANSNTTDSIQKSSSTEQEKSYILQKIALTKQTSLKEQEVAQERLYLNTSVEDKKTTYLALSEIKESKPKKGNWYLSASGFPVYSYHSAGATNKTGTEQQAGIVSMGGSIAVRYEFANRISIESGFSLGFMGQKEKNLNLLNSKIHSFTVLNTNEYSNNYGTLITSNSDYSIVEVQPDNRLSFDVASNLEKVDAYQKFRYLEIPIVVAKRFNIKKLNLFVKGGLSAGFLVQNLLDVKGSNISLKGETRGVDKYITTALTSFGVSVPLLQKFNFIIEPSFKLGLKPLENSKTKSYPFSSFIKFGVEVPI